MAIIRFDRKVGRQIKINKRAEFTFANKYKTEIENFNDFPQRYSVAIGIETFSGCLYRNPRPYYYFEIHKEGHDSFFNLVASRPTFQVVADLAKKIVRIE